MPTRRPPPVRDVQQRLYCERRFLVPNKFVWLRLQRSKLPPKPSRINRAVHPVFKRAL